MNKQEQKRACGLLDTQYGYIKEPEKYLTALSKPQQLAYYDGMKTIIEDLLLGTDLCLVRDENGKHTIESGKENTMVTKAWKVYGREGHRQRESFSPSYTYDFSKPNNTRIITVQNSDKTGTNDYSIVIITRNTEEECNDEMVGQLFDGIFENSAVGDVVEIM